MLSLCLQHAPRFRGTISSKKLIDADPKKCSVRALLKARNGFIKFREYFSKRFHESDHVELISMNESNWMQMIEVSFSEKCNRSPFKIPFQFKLSPTFHDNPEQSLSSLHSIKTQPKLEISFLEMSSTSVHISSKTFFKFLHIKTLQ